MRHALTARLFRTDHFVMESCGRRDTARIINRLASTRAPPDTMHRDAPRCSAKSQLSQGLHGETVTFCAGGQKYTIGCTPRSASPTAKRLMGTSYLLLNQNLVRQPGSETIFGVPTASKHPFLAKYCFEIARNSCQDGECCLGTARRLQPIVYFWPQGRFFAFNSHRNSRNERA